MTVVSIIIRILLAPVVIACAAASCFYAYEFGVIRGGTSEFAVYLGYTAAALDVLKTGLPLLSSYTTERGQKIGAWIGFSVLTCLSLWCAYGMNASQIAERMSNKEVASTIKIEAEELVKRARERRDAMPAFVPTTDGVVGVAEQAVSAAQGQREAECAKRGPRCRDREADERKALEALATARGNLAMTKQAAELDAKVAQAEAALSKVDIKSALKDADPQSESMAKVLGVSVEWVQLLGCILFALGIEVGSGLGFWLVFHARHPEASAHGSDSKPMPAPQMAPAAQAMVAVTPVNQAVLAPLSMTAEQHRSRFLNECLIPTTDYRIPAASLYVAYARWCEDNDVPAMSSHAFGRDIPWEKKRIAGNVFYIGARIIEAYATSPSLRIVASN